ncbi:UNVERIFIED_CONTAM: hypothetical protein K2H54_001368 [Gekko kuhli]
MLKKLSEACRCPSSQLVAQRRLNGSHTLWPAHKSHGAMQKPPLDYDPTSTHFTKGEVYNNINFLRNVVENVIPEDQRADCTLLLNCLHLLSQEDGKPLFIW